MPKYEEGGQCPECGGTLFYLPVEDCSCHLSAPCSACVDNRLLCHDCDFSWHPSDGIAAAPTQRAHPTFTPVAREARAFETEVIYGKPKYCFGQHYTYEALEAFYNAFYNSPYMLYSMDDYGNLFVSSRYNLYEVNSKITPHSTCSMRVSGWYPTHLTMEDVRKKVDGTFGGRFESFHNGQFSFIAYTD